MHVRAVAADAAANGSTVCPTPTMAELQHEPAMAAFEHAGTSGRARSIAVNRGGATRAEAGIPADARLVLVNMLPRLEESQSA